MGLRGINLNGDHCTRISVKRLRMVLEHHASSQTSIPMAQPSVFGSSTKAEKSKSVSLLLREGTRCLRLESSDLASAFISG